MKKAVLALSLFIAYAVVSFAQKQANIWYFGDNAGLDFNSGTPVSLSGSQMATNEGCASIADKTTGEILFYTDGTSVWDASNTAMPGSASGLYGNYSATQSAVIVPKPGSNTLYYIFTVDGQAGLIPPSVNGFGGVAYSIVDMTLRGGLGNISTLNTQLLAPTCEKVTAVRACNGNDIWIVTHQWNSNSFYAYLLSSSGIAAPVITSIGIVTQDIGSGQNAESIGYMKFSPNGKLLAVANYNELNTVQIFNFNNATGVISNPITDTDFPNLSGEDGPYGISFSPDNSRLYVGVFGYVDFFGTSYVYQYNMNAGSNAAILASKTAVLTDYDDEIGALQTGPDGKIYVAKTNDLGGTYLDVITNPNGLGAACNYVSDGLYLTSGTCVFGLPDMVESYLSVPVTATLTYTGCSGSNTVSFTDNALNGSVSTSWNFGDPSSGASNTSALQNPSHAFSASGSYTVTVYFTTTCSVDSFKQTVTVSGGGGSANAGPDTTLCSGNYVQLQATPGGTAYAWSPSAGLTDSTVANPYAIPLVSTTYTVTVTLGSCSSTATVTVDVVTSPPTPNITLSGDTLFCSYDSSYTAYQWYDSTTLISGATKRFILVSQNGNYNVSVSNKNGCSIAVGINVVLTGINNYLSGSSISLSPNPATDEFTIYNLQFTIGRMVIYNTLGQVCSKAEIVNHKSEMVVDISGLSKGVYFLRIEGAQSEWVGKFVKE